MREFWTPLLFLVFCVAVLPVSLITGKAMNPFRQFGSPLIVSRADAPKRYWVSIAMAVIAIPLFGWVVWGTFPN